MFVEAIGERLRSSENETNVSFCWKKKEKD